MVRRYPWGNDTEVNGTDAIQFHPNIERDEVLTVWNQRFAK